MYEHGVPNTKTSIKVLLFPDVNEDALFIHRSDPTELLGSFSDHPFKLDDLEWPSVEHYFQAMKYETSNPELFEKIRTVKSPKQAKKLGRSRFKKIRDDWSQVRRVVMTRAIYTKCKAHSSVAERLLETESRKILEASQYDYFWGCGRDRRGENVYGKVLMDVRNKLIEETGKENA